MSAAPILTILRDGEKLREQPIEGEALLGRGEGCLIRLEDRAISRRHAVFRAVPGGVQVEKKSEFAPLVVNGAECTTALVKEGDIIHIGPYLMRIAVPKTTESAALPPMDAPESSLAGTGLLPPLDAAEAVALEAPAEPAPQADSAMAGFDAQVSPAEGQSDFPSSEDAGALPGFEGGGGVAIEAPAPEFSPAPSVQERAEDTGMVDEDGKTKLTPAAKLAVRLVLPPGMANVTEFELTQDEVSIGRGKNCDIVLNDKKSSRKHAIIRRAGLSFTIKDLESANGVLVNGVRVLEQELTGDDVITIGDVEFQFKAMAADYEARQADFMPVPIEEEIPSELDMPGPMPPLEAFGLDSGFPSPAVAPDPSGPAGAQAPVVLLNHSGAVGEAIPGIAGIPNPNDYKKMSFFEKLRNFKSLPPRQKAIVGFIALGIAFMLLDEDAPPPPAPKAPQKKQTAPAQTGVRTFETLLPEQQRFVEAQHSLAFDHYRNKEYDKALYELDKIFALINDYKDSREIQTYAREGQKRVQAIEEEKRKKEEEERLKVKIQQLVDEAKGLMDKKRYEQAKALFDEILTLDPDNLVVAGWQKEIEEHDEALKLKEQEKQIQGEINKRAYEMLAEAMAIKKSGRYHSAIAEFAKIPDIGASDPRPARRAKAQIAACRKLIADRREPLLAEGKAAEEAGEFAKAYQAYKRATKVDPPHRAGYAGMNRVRDVLHEKSKLLYTEAVLAESYSDFSQARRKYKEVLDTAPEDDIYYARAQRKLSKFFRREEASQ